MNKSFILLKPDGFCQQCCVNTQVELGSVSQISFQVCQNIG